MRQLFKVAYTIIGILLAIFIVVKVVNSLKSTKPPPIPNDATSELEKYTAQLKGLEKQMKADVDGADTPICIINDDTKTGYLYQKQQIQIVFDKVKGDNLLATADRKAVDAYNGIYSSVNAFTDKADNLLPCSEYCYQGTWDNSLACECKDSYPVPIIYKDSTGKDRVYCWSNDCELQQNRQFMPGSSPDPSKNQCNCLPGYVEKDGNCISQADQQLIDLTTNINADTNKLNFFFCKIDAADAIVADLGNLKKAAIALIQNPGNIISPGTRGIYSSAQQAADTAINKYNGFTMTCDKYCGNTAKYEEDTNPGPGACVCNDPNAMFNPNSTSDNKCTSCNVGYEQGLNNKCVLKNNSDTNTLISNTSKILELTKDIVKKCTYCISPETFGNNVDSINTMQNTCDYIITKNNPGPSLESYNAYSKQKDASSKIIKNIEKLKKCDDYCGYEISKYDPNSNTCICYDKNAIFNDFNRNCTCIKGYNKCGGTQCEDCSAILDDQTNLLNTDYTNIQNTVTNTNTFNTFGQSIAGGKIPFIIKPRSNIRSKPLFKKVITANTLSDCAANLQTASAFSFLPGSLSDNCILYTSGNVKNTIRDETSIYGYGILSDCRNCTSDETCIKGECKKSVNAQCNVDRECASGACGLITNIPGAHCCAGKTFPNQHNQAICTYNKGDICDFDYECTSNNCEEATICGDPRPGEMS